MSGWSGSYEKWTSSNTIRPTIGGGSAVGAGSGLCSSTSRSSSTRSSDATALSDGESAPFSRVQAAETGLRWRWEGIADRLGFESVWMAEHLVFPLDMSGSPHPGDDTPPVPPTTPVFDVFGWLCHIAGRTRRIRRGTPTGEQQCRCQQ